ncbi:MAG: HipA domain-containing protein [Chitinophagaceae bacterium]|nr:HipA domain-containing protein [Chitinophagaceae bacterium]
MRCSGCYTENTEGYCSSCRKKLFDGKKVSNVLLFDTPRADNLIAYQEQTKRLSISGVQLKYSLKLIGKEMVLTDRGGEYILKPIPPSMLIALPDQAPENEHLTMQIANQLFKIPVADNALIYFKDGAPAYITRRFDVKPDRTKYLQEDFAQISGSTKKSKGDNYKYEGTYEDIGKLIKSNVAAYMPVMESFFKVVLFNYIISNGDAHLKNFSLIQTDFGDFTLSKAYDLMCTVLHTSLESDTALDLYIGDIKSEFYQKNGFFGRTNFEILAEKIEIMPGRAKRIIDSLLGKQNEVLEMINCSFLNEETRHKYINAYRDKIKRFDTTAY